MQGLDGCGFRRRLRSRRDVRLYASAVSCRLLLNEPKYSWLRSRLSALPLDAPTTITVPADGAAGEYAVVVTTIPANHCAGSVMFLLEGAGGHHPLHGRLQAGRRPRLDSDVPPLRHRPREAHRHGLRGHDALPTRRGLCPHATGERAGLGGLVRTKVRRRLVAATEASRCEARLRDVVRVARAGLWRQNSRHARSDVTLRRRCGRGEVPDPGCGDDAHSRGLRLRPGASLRDG
ncbi:hypothetical protein MRX96_023790 [Rhipicephalus microplus]